MKRRSFLGVFAAIAATAGLPVAAAPKAPESEPFWLSYYGPTMRPFDKRVEYREGDGWKSIHTYIDNRAVATYIELTRSGFPSDFPSCLDACLTSIAPCRTEWSYAKCELREDGTIWKR